MSFSTRRDQDHAYMLRGVGGQPRTTLPDMNTTATREASQGETRITGTPDAPQLVWDLVFKARRDEALTPEQRLAKAEELLGHLRGAPHFATLSIDPDGNLRVEHQCGPMHLAVTQRLERVWEAFGGGPVQIHGVRGEAYASIIADDGSLGVQPVPFLRRTVRTHAGSLDVDAHALNTRERAVLDKWTGNVDPAAKLLARLGDQPKNLSQKLERLEEMSELSVFSPFVVDALKTLSTRFDASALSDVNVRYNGHAMFSMAPLAWAITRMFPSKSFKLLTSEYSGSRESGNLLRFLMRPQDELLDRASDTIATMAFVHDVMKTSEVALEATMPVLKSRVAPAERFIWEKEARLLNGGLPPDAIASGQHRFIIHNADDKKAADKHKDFWGVELWSAKIKALEARFIGELYALLGAREVRDTWQSRIGNCEARIIGAGLLGMGVVEALVRFGMPKNAVVVLDKDEAIRKKAEALGVRAYDPNAAPMTAYRTIAYVATGTACINAKNASILGPQSIVFGMNSGGNVVESPGLFPLRVNDFGFEWPVNTGRGVAKKYRNQTYTLGQRRDHGLTSRAIQEINAIAAFMPANLLHEQWVDRFHVTAMGVTATLLQSANQKTPGIFRLNAEIDDALCELASAMMAPRPLDPRYDESPSKLASDLAYGFRPDGALFAERMYL